MALAKMIIIWRDEHNYGTGTRDQEPKDDSDSPVGCHEDGKLGWDSFVYSVTWEIF